MICNNPITSTVFGVNPLFLGDLHLISDNLHIVDFFNLREFLNKFHEAQSTRLYDI